MSLKEEAEMERLITNREVEFVRLEFADAHGCSRGLHLNAPYFLNNYSKGFHKSQCMLSMTPSGEFVMGTGMFHEVSYRNAAFLPDLATFTVLPWLDKTASVLVDLRTVYGDVHSCSSRSICKDANW